MLCVMYMFSLAQELEMPLQLELQGKTAPFSKRRKSVLLSLCCGWLDREHSKYWAKLRTLELSCQSKDTGVCFATGRSLSNKYPALPARRQTLWKLPHTPNMGHSHCSVVCTPGSCWFASSVKRSKATSCLNKYLMTMHSASKRATTYIYRVVPVSNFGITLGFMYLSSH